MCWPSQALQVLFKGLDSLGSVLYASKQAGFSWSFSALACGFSGHRKAKQESTEARISNPETLQNQAQYNPKSRNLEGAFEGQILTPTPNPRIP